MAKRQFQAKMPLGIAILFLRQEVWRGRKQKQKQTKKLRRRRRRRKKKKKKKKKKCRPEAGSI